VSKQFDRNSRCNDYLDLQSTTIDDCYGNLLSFSLENDWDTLIQQHTEKNQVILEKNYSYFTLILIVSTVHIVILISFLVNMIQVDIRNFIIFFVIVVLYKQYTIHWTTEALLARTVVANDAM
jgi:hypothetical protein